MGRTVVRRVEGPRTRQGRDWLLLAGGAVVVVFALIGVISAGAWVGSKLASSPSHAHSHSSGGANSSSLAVQDVTRAQAQATAIVRAAQSAGQAIVTTATGRAHRRAQSIIAAARRQVAAAAPTAPAATTGSTSASASGQSSGVAQSGTTGSGGTGSSTNLGAASSGASSGASGVTAPTTPSSPNLSGLPASWLVVGYNATFGTGPGSAGSISVINRSSKTFSGTAEVIYTGPSGTLGSASAPFAGLAPGQSEVLPLNGEPYPAGATNYHIEIVDVH